MDDQVDFRIFQYLSVQARNAGHSKGSNWWSCCAWIHRQTCHSQVPSAHVVAWCVSVKVIAGLASSA